jgi:hypothetical protein
VNAVVARRACLTVLVVLSLVSCKKEAPPESEAPAPTPAAPRVSQPACSFAWIEKKSDENTWKKVSEAFHQELLPDSPNTDSAAGRAYTHKEITRMARCDDSVLVVIEKSASERQRAKWDRPSELFNFNLAANRKTPITASWPLWLWTLEKLAHFDSHAVPDVVFTSESCTECEPLTVLSALRFNRATEKFELRDWPENKEGIVVNDATIAVGGSVKEYQTLYGIADFEGKGYDQVALWRHGQESSEDPSKPPTPVTTVTLFRFQTDVPLETPVTSDEEISRLKAVLCSMNPKNSACRSAAIHPRPH